MGWTYVLVNDDGLIKFGKSILPVRTRIKQINGYPGFRFLMAFSGVELESVLHNHFEDQRCCYIPLEDSWNTPLNEYKTALEVESLDNTARFRKTRKELFKLEFSYDLKDYLISEINKLGSVVVEMKSVSDVLPFNDAYTMQVMSKLVIDRAYKKSRTPSNHS
ncbi:TPA: hypothetical protein NJ249_004674 [Vibrio parahaemolyticus]|nr:hypothetical protein [Vibrio parahaemolyticus]